MKNVIHDEKAGSVRIFVEKLSTVFRTVVLRYPPKGMERYGPLIDLFEYKFDEKEKLVSEAEMLYSNYMRGARLDCGMLLLRLYLEDMPVRSYIDGIDDFAEYCFDYADNILLVENGEVKTLAEVKEDTLKILHLWNERFPIILTTKVEGYFRGTAIHHIELDLYTDSITEEVISKDSLSYYLDIIEQSIY